MKTIIILLLVVLLSGTIEAQSVSFIVKTELLSFGTKQKDGVFIYGDDAPCDITMTFNHSRIDFNNEGHTWLKLTELVIEGIINIQYNCTGDTWNAIDQDGKACTLNILHYTATGNWCFIIVYNHVSVSYQVRDSDNQYVREAIKFLDQ